MDEAMIQLMQAMIQALGVEAHMHHTRGSYLDGLAQQAIQSVQESKQKARSGQATTPLQPQDGPTSG